MSALEAYAEIERAFIDGTTDEAIASLTIEQRRRLWQFWIDRANGELTTALTFEFMLDDLRAESVPDSILELAEQAIADEHRHAEWCLRWARRIDGAADARHALGGTRPLRFEGATEHDERLLRTVFGCCFSETAALHVLLASHALIDVDAVRRLNHEHAKEEVGHARLGWALLGWEGLAPRDRGMIASHIPTMLELTRGVWQKTARASDDDLHRLGYLSTPLVAAALDDAIDSVVLPGLDYHGVKI